MKHFILDAFNIIYKDKKLKEKLKNSIDFACNALLGFIASLTDRYPSYKITVVFDGNPVIFALKSKNIKIVNSGTKKIADEVIKDIINRENSKSLLVVVSSDFEVYNYAKLSSCDVMRSEEFLDYIDSLYGEEGYLEDGDMFFEKPKAISEDEMEELKMLFSDEKDLKNLERMVEKKKKEIRFENKKISSEEMEIKKKKVRKDKPTKPDPEAEDKPDIITKSDIEELKRLFEGED